MSQSSNPRIPTAKEAKELLWRKGAVHWKLDTNQKTMYDSLKNSTKKIDVIVSSRQLGKCLAEGTSVMTSNGLVNIEHLKVGDIVYGYNKDGSVSLSKVKGILDSGIKEVVDLTHRGVTWATSSLDHVWLVTEDSGATWVERKVKDFKARSKIRRVFVDMPGGSIKEPHAYVIGAFLGDGCNAKSINKSNGLSISSENEEIPSRISSILGCFLTKRKGNNYTWNFTSELPSGKGNRMSKLSFRYYDEWLKDRYAHEKTIDLNIIKTWDRESQLQLLAGLLDTDGSVVRFGNELSISYCGQSKSILDCVQYLINYHFQYNAKILIDTREKYKNGPVFYLSITNNLINKRIVKTLTPYLAKKKKQWKEEYSNLPEHNCKSEYMGFKQENKRHVQCYDISIDNDTSLYLLANGLVTHNSYLLSAYAIEFCLQNPNSFVKMIAPQLLMIRNIIRPVMREILIDCPEDLEPKIPTNTNIIKFKNGSEIQLAGTDGRNSDALRGTKAHLCIVDEAAFCDDLDYLIKSVLVPMTTTTKGKIILSSTPPQSNDHAFIRFWEKAESDGTLILKTIYDNPRLSPDELQMLCEASGGENSIAFRREYLCQKIVSEDDAVVPEFTKDRAEQIVKEWPRPAYYDAYASMDIGFRDLTVVLFAYYDFKNAKLVIEDELVENGKKLLVDTFSQNILKKEASLWVHPLTKDIQKPYLRISDNNNLQFLNEMQIKHQLTFVTTHKLEAEAALTNMRQMIKNGKIIINPRCKVLISHLKNAIWNKSRQSYVRSSDHGHYDAIDSLKYLCKNVNFNKNPYPASYQFSSIDDMFLINNNLPKDKFSESLVNMFKMKSPRARKPFNK